MSLYRGLLVASFYPPSRVRRSKRPAVKMYFEKARGRNCAYVWGLELLEERLELTDCYGGLAKIDIKDGDRA